jgi:putative ABC transport system substrate-binding protein
MKPLERWMGADSPALPLSRRRFVHSAGLAGLGLLAGCGQLPGQPATRKVPHVGVIWLNPPEAFQPFIAAIKDGLADLGYVDEQNIRIESRWADGRAERFPELVSEMLALPVDILVAAAEPAALVAKQATTTTPIVIAIGSDPVGAGLVTSLARPGGNVTGLSSLAPQLTGKRLELLRAAFPDVTRVDVLGNPVAAETVLQFQEAASAAQVLGMGVHRLEAAGPDALDRVLAAPPPDPGTGVLVLSEALFMAQRTKIVEWAARRHSPAMYARREFVEAGGLMAYGPSLRGTFRRVAYYIDRILKGAKPADLPIEQPREFDFVVNVRTAQALGLTIPQHILLQATEIIQ